MASGVGWVDQQKPKADSTNEKKITPNLLGSGGNGERWRAKKKQSEFNTRAGHEILRVIADSWCRGRRRLDRIRMIMGGKEWLKWVSLLVEPRLLEWTWAGHDFGDGDGGQWGRKKWGDSRCGWIGETLLRLCCD